MISPTLYTDFAQHQLPAIELAIHDYLNQSFSDQRQILMEAMKYAAQNGGKRMRPVLALASFQLYSSDISAILPFAVAIELLHTYSLIHDDLPAMDNDTMRRGRPTCHIQFGEDIAILAGDTLNTCAFELLANLPFSPELVLDAIRRFALACGITGMSGGQVLDLKATHSSASASASVVETIHRLKTGALIEVGISIPALLAGATPEHLQSLTQFGKELGLLFQIRDDILDVIGGKELGKTPQKDLAQNKLTYCLMYGLEGAKDKMNSCADRAMVALSELPMRTDLLASCVSFGLVRDS